MSPNPIPEVPCQKWLTTTVNVSLDHHDVETSQRIQKRRDDPDEDEEWKTKIIPYHTNLFSPLNYVSHN